MMNVLEKLGFNLFLINYLAHVIKRQDSDLFHRLSENASNESMDYVMKNMKNAICFRRLEKYTTLNHGITNISVDGDVLEFGVFKGSTTRFIAKKLKNKTIHGFDSFVGLPSDWSGSQYTKEDFLVNGKIPKLPKNVKIWNGWFNDTLPKYLESTNNKISFLHIDCDIYESTKTVFDNLKGRIVKGTIICFDEYMNYNQWQQHEFKAFQEYVKENNIKYEYLSFTGSGRVCVRILGTDDSL